MSKKTTYVAKTNVPPTNSAHVFASAMAQSMLDGCVRIETKYKARSVKEEKWRSELEAIWMSGEESWRLRFPLSRRGTRRAEEAQR
jgi:hypothetical protein